MPISLPKGLDAKCGTKKLHSSKTLVLSGDSNGYKKDVFTRQFNLKWGFTGAELAKTDFLDY